MSVDPEPLRKRRPIITAIMSYSSRSDDLESEDLVRAHYKLNVLFVYKLLLSDVLLGIGKAKFQDFHSYRLLHPCLI